MKRFARFLLWLFGWKLVGEAQKEMQKCVFIEAPHTSMWDFVWGRLGLWQLGVNVRFFIKKEMFFFPLGGILKALGGIPIDRKKSTKMVDQVVEMFNRSDRFCILITPEGTRKYTENWKKGFYFIAQKANVPIFLGYLDYEKKEGSGGKIFYPTGNYEEDILIIKDYYKDKVAKYPENFNLSKQYQKLTKK
ncbi:MAG: lysophospholipid acyltransferase family protein [Bacteroidales bacterium]|nr:lysophospholipid acyltransferase family protein [Bacteroidales bacterium]